MDYPLIRHRNADYTHGHLTIDSETNLYPRLSQVKKGNPNRYNRLLLVRHGGPADIYEATMKAFGII
jgi:hypothetical protein